MPLTMNNPVVGTSNTVSRDIIIIKHINVIYYAFTRNMRLSCLRPSRILLTLPKKEENEGGKRRNISGNSQNKTN